MVATAQAQPNIALVKYWGKRDATLNLPATGSMSLTLASLCTRTRVDFDAALPRDEFLLDGREEPAMLARVSACLDLLRSRAGTTCRASVESSNDFPTGAGLASSASGFAALVVAADAALGLGLDHRALSIIARRGSGSAARSLFGGFVVMDAGQRSDGEDAFPTSLMSAEAWPLKVVIAVTSHSRKQIGSTDGMERSRRTSSFYDAWVEDAEADLCAARAAVLARDFAALADVTERSCMKMHAVMLTSRPALLYWTGATVDCLHRIRALREDDGLAVCYTVDAGPQVKAVCLPADAARVAAALAAVPGVLTVLTSALGAGAALVPDASEP